MPEIPEPLITGGSFAFTEMINMNRHARLLRGMITAVFLLALAGLLLAGTPAFAETGAFRFAPAPTAAPEPAVPEPTVPEPTAPESAAPSVTQAPRPTPAVSAAEQEAEIIARFKGARVYGAVLMVTRDGQEALTVTYGLRDHGDHPVTVNTRFRVASVTKFVSAVALMTLYDQGKLPLDASLAEVLPDPVRNPAFPDIPVTARQTLSHTSSIVPGGTYHPKWENMPKVNRYFKANTAPGSEFNYANLNGGLTGAMIEALSGQSVNTYVTEHLFAPLGIDAAYTAGLLADQSDIAEMLKPDKTIHAGVKRQLNQVKVYNDTCDPHQNTEITIGGLYISADGLTRITQMLLAGGVYGGRRILNEDTVRLMELDQQTLPGSSVACDSPYGLGIIRVTDVGEHTWYGHQGRYLGLVANAYYQPDTGLTFTMIAIGYKGGSENHLSHLSRKLLTYVDQVYNGTHNN